MQIENDIELICSLSMHKSELIHSIVAKCTENTNFDASYWESGIDFFAVSHYFLCLIEFSDLCSPTTFGIEQGNYKRAVGLVLSKTTISCKSEC